MPGLNCEWGDMDLRETWDLVYLRFGKLGKGMIVTLQGVVWVPLSRAGEDHQ